MLIISIYRPILLILTLVFSSLLTMGQWDKNDKIELGRVYGITKQNQDNYLLSIGGIYFKNKENENWQKLEKLPPKLKEHLHSRSLRQSPLYFKAEGDFLFLYANQDLIYLFSLTNNKFIEFDVSEILNEIDTNYTVLDQQYGVVGNRPVFSFKKQLDTTNQVSFFLYSKTSFDKPWERLIERENINILTFPYVIPIIYTLDGKGYILGDSIGCINFEKKIIKPCVEDFGYPVNARFNNLKKYNQGFLTHFINKAAGQQNPIDAYYFDGTIWTEIAETAYVDSKVDSVKALSGFKTLDNLGIFAGYEVLSYQNWKRYLWKYDHPSREWHNYPIPLPINLNFVTEISENLDSYLFGMSDYGIVIQNKSTGYLEKKSIGFNQGKFSGIRTFNNKVSLFSDVGLLILNDLKKESFFSNYVFQDKIEKVFAFKSGTGLMVGGGWKKLLYFSSDGINYDLVVPDKSYGFGGGLDITFSPSDKADILLQFYSFNNEPFKFEISNDFGATWIDRTDYFPGPKLASELKKLKFIISDGQLYMKEGERIYQTPDTGKNWIAIPRFPGAAFIQEVFFEYLGKPTLVNKLYNFKNIGDYQLLSWDNDFEKWLKADTLPTNPLGMETFDLPATFVYNDSVVFVKHDTGREWQEVSTGLPNENIYITGMARLQDSLFLSTDGFGVYRMAISDVPGFGKDTVSTTFNPINAFDFKVFPNPSTGNIGLELMPHSAPLFAEVIDLTGKSLIHSIIEAQTASFTIPIENLMPGVYFLKVSDRESIFQTKKIIVH